MYLSFFLTLNKEVCLLIKVQAWAMISYSADPLLHLCWFQLNDTAVPYDDLMN